MFLELHAERHPASKRLVCGRLFLGMFRVSCCGGMLTMRSRRAVDLVELLGAFWTFEIMTLAGHSTCRNRQKQGEEKFHCAAS